MRACLGVDSLTNNLQIAWISRCLVYPLQFPGNFLDYLLCECYCRPAGRIFFFCVVNFFKSCVIFALVRHKTRKQFVDLKKNIYANTKIAGIEKGAIVFPAKFDYLLKLAQPTRGTRNHRSTGFQARHNVLISAVRSSELDRNIGLCQRNFIKLAKVADVDFQYYFMTSLNCHIFNSLTHLTVSD